MLIAEESHPIGEFKKLATMRWGKLWKTQEALIVRMRLLAHQLSVEFHVFSDLTATIVIAVADRFGKISADAPAYHKLHSWIMTLRLMN